MDSGKNNSDVDSILIEAGFRLEGGVFGRLFYVDIVAVSDADMRGHV